MTHFASCRHRLSNSEGSPIVSAHCLDSAACLLGLFETRGGMAAARGLGFGESIRRPKFCETGEIEP
jgi:hypothetical protein